MTVIYILIAISGLIAVGFLAAFIWGLKSGQWDDTHTPSIRMLFDDEKNGDKKEKKLD